MRVSKCSDFVKILPEAVEQDGIITRAQMHRLGLRDDAIHRLCQEQDGLCQAIRGVYVIPPLLTATIWDAYAIRYHALEPALFLREKATPELAAKYGAISHVTAGDMHECTSLPMECHLTSPKRRRIQGAHTHISTLTPEDITIIDGLPVTTLERTTRDLGRMQMDGEHRARWIDFLYNEHGWPKERTATLIGPKAARESLHHCMFAA